MPRPETGVPAPLLGLVSYRQLDYWVRAGWLQPDNAKPGCGYYRSWPAAEIQAAERMAHLVAAGLPYRLAAAVAHGQEWITPTVKITVTTRPAAQTDHTPADPAAGP